MKLSRINESDERIRSNWRDVAQGSLEEQFAYHRRVLRRMGEKEKLAYLFDLNQSGVYKSEFIWDLVRGYDFGGLEDLVSKIGAAAVKMGLMEGTEFTFYNVEVFLSWSKTPSLGGVRVVWKSNFGGGSARARLVFEDNTNWYLEDSPVIFAGSIILEDNTTTFTKRVPLDLGVPQALYVVVGLLRRVVAGDRTASGVHVVRSA